MLSICFLPMASLPISSPNLISNLYRIYPLFTPTPQYPFPMSSFPMFTKCLSSTPLQCPSTSSRFIHIKFLVLLPPLTYYSPINLVYVLHSSFILDLYCFKPSLTLLQLSFPKPYHRMLLFPNLVHHPSPLLPSPHSSSLAYLTYMIHIYNGPMSYSLGLITHSFPINPLHPLWLDQ